MISSLSAKVNTQAFMQTVWCDKMNWLNTPLNNWFNVSFIIQIINYKWFNRQIYGWFVRIEATCKNAKCVTLHALELLYCWQSASPTLSYPPLTATSQRLNTTWFIYFLMFLCLTCFNRLFWMVELYQVLLDTMKHMQTLRCWTSIFIVNINHEGKQAPQLLSQSPVHHSHLWI